MAKIAVDARPLADPTTGIGRYTWAVLKRLIRSEHNWYLYSHKPLLHDFGLSQNVVIRSGNIRPNALGSIFAQAVFPVWCRRDRVDLFWTPRHHLPMFIGASTARLVTIHDLVWKMYPYTMPRLGRYLERALMPQSLKKADAVVAVSDSTADELVESFPMYANKLRTIYEAPFIEASSSRVVLGGYFLFVGTIEPRKNLLRLLDAYNVYQSNVNNPLPLRICGGAGWGVPGLEGLIQCKGLSDYVQVLGYVDDEKLVELYSNARAVLLPSLYEGFGLPIVEAFGQGTPVITSNRGAMREIGGDAALLVDPESVDQIAASLNELTVNIPLVERLQGLATKRAGLFCWDRAAEQTLELMESLISI
ncbi:glycosyltransferase family 1 protein [uncultured Microbulbifer sp.]|uniref:glycosyltransferase family 4 protein n=1 Tax=uncultured Microbulbifer sp. TaxID=348147 RepID=UPI00262F53B0|nr:glycosyltransferase family 1 protein [uncultured Microbulbifer sp.]